MQGKAIIKRMILRYVGLEPYKIRNYIENKAGFLKNDVYGLIRYGQFPMFNEINVETSSYCNRKCPACPTSLFERGKIYMDEKIYEKIVQMLAVIRYSGKISLHFFNEPLEDPSIVEKVRLMSENNPKASIWINTNGDYLTIELLRNLISAGIDKLFITQYDGKIHKHIQNIMNKVNSSERKFISVRAINNFTGNRGGSLENEIIDETLFAGCYLPSTQLVINYKGEVVLCCNDYYGKVVMGRIDKDSLMNIWSNKKFKKMRSLLKKKQRSQIKICEYCNFAGYRRGSKEYLSSDEIIRFNNSMVRVEGGQISP